MWLLSEIVYNAKQIRWTSGTILQLLLLSGESRKKKKKTAGKFEVFKMLIVCLSRF